MWQNWPPQDRFLSGLSMRNPKHYRYQNFCDALRAFDMETDPPLFIDGNDIIDEQSGYDAAGDCNRPYKIYRSILEFCNCPSFVSVGTLLGIV